MGSTARPIVTVALALALTVIAVGPAAASPDDVANRVARDVMSPFCPGLSLHDCPSEASLELREQILEQARAGWSHERIVAELEAEYGADTIRATPPAGGLGLLAWAIPGLALVVGGAVAIARGRRWWRGQPEKEHPPPGGGGSFSDDERARLETELDHLRNAR